MPGPAPRTRRSLATLDDFGLLAAAVADSYLCLYSVPACLHGNSDRDCCQVEVQYCVTHPRTT